MCVLGWPLRGHPSTHISSDPQADREPIEQRMPFGKTQNPWHGEPIIAIDEMIQIVDQAARADNAVSQNNRDSRKCSDGR